MPLIPKLTVAEVADQENKLRRVTLRLSDETYAELVKAFPEHGTECGMTATFTLPAELMHNYAPGANISVVVEDATP